jgi:anti-sigma factor RsiW
MGDGTVGCETHDALMGYLYDECDEPARSRIAAHLERCPACAGEVAALGDTRQQLRAWVPPEAPLDNRLPHGAGAPGTGRPAAVWWHRPLPAWAQVAAAGLIFVAGVTIGGTRVPSPEAVVPVADVTAAEPAVPAAGLAQVEERLRTALLAQVQAEVQAMREGLAEQVRARAPVPAVDEEALWRRIETAIEESEGRQRMELALRTVEVARALDGQRRADLHQMQGLLGQQHEAILHLAQLRR